MPTNLHPEDKLQKKKQKSYEKEIEDVDLILGQKDYTEADVKELQVRNKILLEALRKVKLLVERLLIQNRELKRRVGILEVEFDEQTKKGVQMVSVARYKEMQSNATELARSLPKLIKLIKLLNKENKLVKEKYSALENEFEDLIDERDDLKQTIYQLNETSQEQVITELTEMFPTDAIATKIATKVADAMSPSMEEAIINNNIEPEAKTIASATSVSVPSFEDQARTDLDQVAGFNNQQVSMLVDLVMEIKHKIENLSGTMVVPASVRKRGKADLDLTDAITDAEMADLDDPPDRPDLEEVLDDILISG
ncbi:MAG: hypothetical protein ACTSUP_00775 [Candidatus Heimdallarchaeaceae archaeon]